MERLELARSTALLVLASALLAGHTAAQQPADLVLRNGRIYTVDPAQPWASAVAVRGGVLEYVGDDVGVQAHVGAQTRVEDLLGRFVMPGVHDVHTHLLEAFHWGYTCILTPGRPPESYVPELRFCKNFQQGSSWVIGAGHSIESMAVHIAQGGRPPVEILDDAIPGRPAVIMEETSHSVWVNTKALEATGFDTATSDPPGGVILRDASGKPNGLLLDGAGEIALDLAFAPNPTMQQMNYDALMRGLEAARQNGITSFCDARAHWRRGFVEAYERAELEGRLTARVVLGLWAYPYLDDNTQIAQLQALYDADPQSRLRVSQIKIYSDGEVGHTTAALLDPYTFPWPQAGSRGLNYFDQARLSRYVEELEPTGFDFHIHTIGDRGVHEALDAIAAAAAANGLPDRRHRLTHLEVIDPLDVPRFAALGVTADFQTSSDFVLPVNQPWYRLFLGRARTQQRVLRLRDVADTGARVVLSSDYDVGDLSPFAGMERALGLGAQSLPDLHAVVRAYTIDPAWLMRQEQEVGSLVVGKEADLIVLDRDLFQIPVSELSEVRVLATLVEGEVVYQR